MAKVDPPPSNEVINKRREPRYIIDPKEVTQKEHVRAKQWAAEIMKKHESKLNPNKFKNREIVTSGYIEAEHIDVGGVYKFSDIHWIIYRDDHNGMVMWSIMVMGGKKMLFRSTFATTRSV